MFRTDDDEEDYDDEYPVGSGSGPIYLPLSSEDGHSYWDGEEEAGEGEARERWGRLHAHGQGHAHAQMRRWSRYFRPLTRRAYYSSLFHLVVLNFPYALAAWVYLFVFTVAGTTLLMALPLGAILCFFDLLGARAFARGELTNSNAPQLYLQTKFHSPLSYPPPHPPRPIFTCPRDPTPAELEAPGALPTLERSFYKNTYAMFTDPTSYQALFYFLVIKPALTLVFSLVLL
ncbi:hypothetical protein H0H92_013813, partial [Tricholoma furcatifolium]